MDPPRTLGFAAAATGRASCQDLRPLSQFPRAPAQLDLLALPTSEKKVDSFLHYLAAEVARCEKHDLRLPRLLQHLGVSERQLERGFSVAVGVASKMYVRIRRFNEALRLMKTRRHRTLASVAHELNFSDQSHFIRDLKAFSRITPKGLFERADNFHEMAGFSYEE